MAFMSQERKKELAPGIKEVLKKYGVKATIAVRHHSTLIVNIRSGKVNFDREAKSGLCHYQVNPYWLSDHWEGEALNFLTELKAAMDVGNFDHSDPMTDYFHVGWYIEINVGQYDKPYILEEAA